MRGTCDVLGGGLESLNTLQPARAAQNKGNGLRSLRSRQRKSATKGIRNCVGSRVCAWSNVATGLTLARRSVALWGELRVGEGEEKKRRLPG